MNMIMIRWFGSVTCALCSSTYDVIQGHGSTSEVNLKKCEKNLAENGWLKIHKKQIVCPKCVKIIKEL